MQQLQEDDLQHLEVKFQYLTFFTAFGKLVAKESDETDINNAVCMLDFNKIMHCLFITQIDKRSY